MIVLQLQPMKARDDIIADKDSYFTFRLYQEETNEKYEERHRWIDQHIPGWLEKSTLALSLYKHDKPLTVHKTWGMSEDMGRTLEVHDIFKFSEAKMTKTAVMT